MRVACIQVKANDLKDFQQAWDHLKQKVLDNAKTHDLILVPECASPAYFIHPDEGDLDSVLSHGETFLNQMKEIAKQEKVYIAYGYVEKSEECLYNTALLINRSGEEVIKKRKSFLWHFDSKWFAEGDDVAVANTDFGKIALVVCADARMPEIVRLAALQGTHLIIDLANLTASGPDIAALQNAQSAYMLSVRAMENQVWLAVSDKWGVEANSITYTGRSGVFAPDGTCVYQASSDRDEVASIKIPTDVNGKIICTSTGYNIQRRPELYKPLTEDLDSLPITNLLEEKVIPSSITPYIMAAAGEFSNEEEYIRMVRRLVNQGGQIVCMPPTPLSIHEHVDQIQPFIPEGVVIATTVTNNKNSMTTCMITNKGIEETFHTLHDEGASAKESPTPVYQTQWGRIGIIHNMEAMLPEWPRTLMLLGADCLIWPNSLPYLVASKIARTRAAESRIYVVSAQPKDETSGVSQIVDPNGGVVASTLQNERLHACGALTPFSNSRVKEVVPGTNVVKNRRPGYYGGLL